MFHANRELARKYATKRKADWSAMLFVGILFVVLVSFFAWYGRQVDSLQLTPQEKEQASEMYLNSLGQYK